MDGQSDKPVAFLGMPGYGGVQMGSARAFFRPTGGGVHVHCCYQQASLINVNCNTLWATALNAKVNGGRRLDYFAMLHSDVVPPDGWLDVLIDEMEGNGLDLLACVVPIKDPRGVTSTAVGSGDPFRPKVRLTMNELHRLPETFTLPDLKVEGGTALLFNTGCWVCRFDPAWASKVWFECNDRVEFDDRTGRHEVRNEPEDWAFARMVNALGTVRVGCTRKVALTHVGSQSFASSSGWGEWDFDREYQDAPAIAGCRDPGEFRFPHDAEGWLGEDEGRELARLAAGKRVLEIGSYKGRSTVCLAQTAAAVDCVDTFDGRGTPQPGRTFPDFHATLRRHGLAHKVTAHTGTSDEVCPRLPAGGYALAFIDGSHDQPSVEADIRHALRLLAPGGLLAFHDYRRPGDDDGVTAAVDGLLAAGGELLHALNTLAVVRPPTPVPAEVN